MTVRLSCFCISQNRYQYDAVQESDMIAKTQNILIVWQPICYCISALSDHSKISHTQL